MQAHLVFFLAVRDPGRALDDEGRERSPSTFANTMKKSAKPPLVIHIFSPLSTKPPSGCRDAFAFAPSASDPDPDSLSA